MKFKRLVHTLLAALTILLAAACTTDQPEVIADCFWSATAVAFLDANENGTYDEGEAPLEGIEFILEPSVFSRAVSGSDGSAYIFATTPISGSDTSCEELAAEHPLQVIAAKHEGYRLTTPQMLDYTTAGVEYHFGFKPETAAQSETSPAEDSPLVSGEGGFQLAPGWPVDQVNYLMEWYGENVPVWEYEQIEVQDGRFIHGSGSDVSAEVEQLLGSINALSPAEEVTWTNLWTDDYPEWYIEIVGQDGRRVLLYSESTGFRGHAPWYVEVDGQLYRQTTGDIGFAVYDLVSETAQNYFSLEEQPFDEGLIEPGGRPAVFRQPHPFTGLLPVAAGLTIEHDLAAETLTGSFAWDTTRAGYDSSSRPITGVESVQLDGRSCTISGLPHEEYPELILYTFQCPLSSETTPMSLPIQLTFTTTGGSPLVVEGSLLRPLSE